MTAHQPLCILQATGRMKLVKESAGMLTAAVRRAWNLMSHCRNLWFTWLDGKCEVWVIEDRFYWR